MAIRFQFKSLLIEIDGSIILSSVMKYLAQLPVRSERQRIELEGALGLGNRFIRLRIEEQIERIPLMGLSVIRIEFDRALERCFGVGPLKAVHVGVGERGICLS